MAFHPNGKTIAIAFYNQLKFWDINSGIEIEKSKKLSHNIHSLAYHPHNYFFAAALENSAIEVWNNKKVFKLKKFAQNGAEFPVFVKFSSDGHFLVAASGAKIIYILNFLRISRKILRIFLMFLLYFLLMILLIILLHFLLTINNLFLYVII